MRDLGCEAHEKREEQLDASDYKTIVFWRFEV